eukprot:1063096-Rhodomonas_salina.1
MANNRALLPPPPPPPPQQQQQHAQGWEGRRVGWAEGRGPRGEEEESGSRRAGRTGQGGRKEEED